MAQKIIVYWRDIPAQILVKKGRKSARREMPAVFMEAIDACAMRIGAKDSDAYMAEWRRADPVDVSDDLEAEAEAALSELASAYPKERLKTLLASGGTENE
ncbi:virulence factor [Roseibium marinum]|uniref:CvfA/B/C family virulence factor n=1 Tax=Roseibium marinum TaxID=281252 RepID=A0A2S3UMI4_9HYPH|nr:virulence factor [Roseibium marinum]POF28891.1 cvfA/B/C family virulence factor [Roseibium marinum]